MLDFDCQEAVIDTFSQPEKNMSYAVVVHKSVIKKIINVVDDLDLNLITIDIPEFSYRNALDYYSHNHHGVALILINSNEGKLLIIKEGNIYFSRRFSVDYTSDENSKILEEDIVLELQRSLDYYERQMGQSSPGEILLGGDVFKKEMLPVIEDNFQQVVSYIDIEKFSINYTVSENDGLYLPVVDMLALSGAALSKESVL